MLRAVEDLSKRRLTERFDILAAIEFMRSRGCRTEEIILEITKVFYVDLDEFNEALKSHRAAYSPSI